MATTSTQTQRNGHAGGSRSPPREAPAAKAASVASRQSRQATTLAPSEHATSGATSHMREVQRVLSKLGNRRHLPQQDEAAILAAVAALEADLQVQRRRETRRRQRAEATEEAQGALGDEVAALQTELGRLTAQLAARDEALDRSRQELAAAKAEISRLRDACEDYAHSRDALAQERTELAACSFAVAARAEAEGSRLGLARGGGLAGRRRAGRGRSKAGSVSGLQHPRTSRRSLTLLGSTDQVQSFLAPEDDAGSERGEPAAITPPPPSEPNAQTTVLALIGAATTSICVMTHAFTSRTVGEALAAAAKRGVAVQVLYDAAWVEMVLNAGPASLARGAWERVFRRWRASGVAHGGVRGTAPGTAPTRTGAISASAVPLEHNLLLVDTRRLLVGAYRFADALALGESSCVLVEGGSNGDGAEEEEEEYAGESGVPPCVLLAQSFFDRCWARRVGLSQPGDMTTVRLPKLTVV